MLGVDRRFVAGERVVRLGEPPDWFTSSPTQPSSTAMSTIATIATGLPSTNSVSSGPIVASRPSSVWPTYSSAGTPASVLDVGEAMSVHTADSLTSSSSTSAAQRVLTYVEPVVTDDAGIATELGVVRRERATDEQRRVEELDLVVDLGSPAARSMDVTHGSPPD